MTLCWRISIILARESNGLPALLVSCLLSICINMVGSSEEGVCIHDLFDQYPEATMIFYGLTESETQSPG